jgi:hypothetical protein
MERVAGHTRFRRREKPSVKQVYALAAALCTCMGEEFPASRSDASELIQRLWEENGDPRAQLSAARFDRGEEAVSERSC